MQPFAGKSPLAHVAVYNSKACPVVQELKDDLIERCGTGEYNDKTILFCWEHKNIPYIVAKLGFSGKKDLTWGLNPESGVRLRSQCLACIASICFLCG